MFIVTAKDNLPVNYSNIHGQFRKELPDVARYVVFHNFARKEGPADTIEKLSKRASRLFEDFRLTRQFERFENTVRDAIREGESQTRLHDHLICVIPERIKGDKEQRLAEFFGFAVAPDHARTLWPTFLDFSARMLLGLAVFMHDHKQSDRLWHQDAYSAAIGTSDAFAVLWQIKTHGADTIVPFTEEIAVKAPRRKDRHYRTEYALREAYRFGASPEGRAWLKTASLPEIYAKAQSIWQGKPRPAPLDREAQIRQRLLDAAAEFDRRNALSMH